MALSRPPEPTANEQHPATPGPERFGAMLAALRQQRGLTQKEVAHRVGLTVEHLCRVERGHRPPLRRHYLERVIEVLRLAPAEASRLLASAGYDAPAAGPEAWQPSRRGPDPARAGGVAPPRTEAGGTTWDRLDTSLSQMQQHLQTLEQAVTEHQRTTERLRFLCQANRTLVTSLDLQATLDSVTRLVVPALADWCAVELAGRPDRIQRTAAGQPLAVPPAACPAPADRPAPPAAAPRPLEIARHQGRPLLIAHVDDVALAALARDGDDLALLRGLELRSAIVAPLVVRGLTLGVLLLGAGRHYDEADLELVEELAASIALALDNARLYEAEEQARRAAEDAADRTARLQAVTAALAETLTQEHVASVLVEQSVAALGAAAGLLRLPSADGQWLEVVSAINMPALIWTDFRRLPVASPALMPRAFRTGQTLVVSSYAEMSAVYPPLAPLVEEVGEGSFMAVPLLLEGRAIGAVGLHFDGVRDFAPDDLAFVQALAGQCAQALERARLYEAERQARAEAEASRQRLAFLATVNGTLAASLDYETTLAAVARLMVPALADYCVVDLVEDGPLLRRVAAAHADPASEPLVQALRRFPPDLGGPNPIAAAIRLGQTVVCADFGDSGIQASSRDPEHYRIVKALGLRSFVAVPLMVEGRMLGAITLVSAGSGRRYDQDDLLLAEEVASSAALAIDRARLFRATQRMLAELRHPRDFMPADAPDLSAWAAAAEQFVSSRPRY
jgi:GAF domain-containing protein/DNA-binding XRE family transcriptional regulator